MGGPVKFEIEAPDTSPKFEIDPPDAPPTPGAFRRFGSSYAQGAGVVSAQQGKDFFRHPIDTAKGMLESQGALGVQAAQEFKRGDYPRAIQHGIEYLIPGAGPTLAHAGEQAEKKDYAGSLGTTLGLATTIAVSPESVRGGLSKVGDLRAKFQPFARKFTGVEPAVKESVTKAAEKQGSALAEHADTSANVAKRGELSKTVDEQSQQLHGHLKNVEASVYKEANSKFQAVREKIGNPEVDATPLVDTVKNVETNVLQGIPENIKEFRSIMEHQGVPEGVANAVERHYGWTPEGPEALTWDKLQSLKSRIDARLRSRAAINGDLKRGLYQTRDAIVGEMGRVAEAKGATAEWTDARNFWRQYKEDFDEPTGPSGSGSPVAQALEAKDPKNIRQPFLRTQSSIGNRGIDILKKYPQHGGTEAAMHTETLIKNHQDLQDLPNKPKGFSPDKPPAEPVVNVDKVARDAISQRAKNWGYFNARDIGILSSGYIGGILQHVFTGGGEGLPIAVTAFEGGKFAASRALTKPAVVEWLAKTPQSEIDVLNKIPGVDKVRIVNAITNDAVQTGKSGRLSPQARMFLGPTNVARIIAATGAVSSGHVKNRKDALTALGR